MNKNLIFILMLSFSLYSCGEKSTHVSTNNIASKFKLGKFEDIVSPPSHNEEHIKSLSLPDVVDLSEYMTSVKDQGQRATCTFFASVGLVEAAIKQDLKKEVNLSEEYINYASKEIDFKKTEFSDERLNLQVITTFGALLEKDWPYQPSWFQKGFPCEGHELNHELTPQFCYSHYPPTEEVLKKRINTSQINYKSPAFDGIDVIIATLGISHRPTLISIPINYKGWPNSGDVFYNEDLRQECLSNPNQCGFHSIILTGFDLKKKVFFFKNSWGKNWGKNGYGTITFDTVDRYITMKPITIATIEEELDLPKNYEEPAAIEAVNFASNLKYIDDGSVEINTNAEIKNVGNYHIYMSNVLAYSNKDESGKSISKLHTLTADEIALNNKNNFIESYKYFSSQPDTSSIIWSNENPAVVNFRPEILGIPSVDKLIKAKESEAFFRTSIYLYTDEGYIPLNHADTPVTKL